MTRTRPGAAVLLVAMLGCSRPAADPAESGAAVEDSVTFINRVWEVAESDGASPGDLVVFLSEGTLVFASAHGEPAFGKWTYEDGSLTMVEEGIPYKVEILGLTGAEFRIRSHNPGGSVEIRYVPADGGAAESS